MPKPKILPELRELIPPLSADELAGLERNLIANGCRVPLDVWSGKDIVLIDGHNRFEICERLGIRYDVRAHKFDDINAVKLWMIDNQLDRRNLALFAIVELNVIKVGIPMAAEAERNKTRKPADSVRLKKAEQIDTKAEVAKVSKTSRATVTKVKKLMGLADNDTKAKLRNNEISINEAHAAVVREEKRAEIIETLENIETKTQKALSGRYDVIVIDPPWPMKKIERDERPNQSEFSYPTMKEAELAALEMPAADNCHLWLWTTHKFLPMALRLLDSWEFKYVCAFTWHKPGGFQPIGLPQYNCEFALYARRGSPKFIDTKAFPTCFNAPRGEHSEKPEEFYDMVRRVTAGVRIDVFNRRQINGFDTWGKESK